MSSATARSQRRAASQSIRVQRLAADGERLEGRVNQLTAEVTLLTGRHTALAGYSVTAPLGAPERVHQMAGLVAGGAAASLTTAGANTVGAAARDLRQAMPHGSAATVGALLDLAAEALAWAATLSLGDAEPDARVPAWGGRQDVANRINRDRTAGVMRLRAGDVSARDVLIGSVAPSLARHLGRTPWDVVLLEAGATLDQVKTVVEHVGLEQGVRLADLEPEHRHDIVAELAA